MMAYMCVFKALSCITSHVIKSQTSVLTVSVLNQYGKTALMSVADRGHAEVVRFMLDRGADTNKRDDVSNYFFSINERQQ